MKDSYYTPDFLAEQLVSFIDYKELQNIVDFSAGEGELLKAAEKKWPKANIYGLDINKEAIQKISQNNSNWKLEIANFMEVKEPFRKDKNRFDLILLNPPFTCRGATRYQFEYDGKVFKTSIAIYFVLKSLKYLTKEGKLYAILPLSSAFSEKDNEAWSFLRTKFNLKVVCIPEKKYFKNCSVKILMVSINDDNSINTLLPSVQINHGIQILDIKRGNISMHEVKTFDIGTIPLVHSTNLINGRVSNLMHYLNTKRSLINGPCLLITRVGLPKKEKLVVITEHDNYILSDCVLALKTSNVENAFRLREILISNWSSFELLYTGTGARYITLNKLNEYLKVDLQLNEIVGVKGVKMA